MPTSRYLRDARHLNKAFYTVTHDLFYEPFETEYRPSQEYVDIVKALLSECRTDWTVTRDGPWCHVHPIERYVLPLQGWKVHVSAIVKNGASILTKAARVALTQGIPFKFALDRNVLGVMGSKMWPRGGSGKFITMYPAELARFKHLLEELYEELHADDGPYVLSDKRYKDCRVLYYRYGGIARNTRLDITGQKILVLETPGGEPVPDVRTPYFAVPAWTTDPFGESHQNSGELTLNAGKYVVKSAFSFSNSGGVYLAQERDGNRDVVIKEARRHAVVDQRGIDATSRLEKEYGILDRLRDTGITPRPVEFFREWENVFLAEEFIEGIDLRQVILQQSPLVRARPSLDETTQYYGVYTKLARNLAAAFDVLHEHDVVFGDVSPNNFKINPDTYSIRLIDVECSLRVGIDEPTDIHTAGFKKAASIRRDSQTVEDDLYGLAALMLYMLFPIAALSSLRSDLLDRVLKILLADIGWSNTRIFDVIDGLAKNTLTCRDACQLLDEPAQVVAPGAVSDADIDAEWYDKSIEGLGRFLLAHVRTDPKAALFPADPFMHQTNSLSLGFGACGVLYALKKCGLEIPAPAYDWLEHNLDRANHEELAPGLMCGTSGIAWCTWELGLEDRAVRLMDAANHSAILERHHSYFHGMAGVGMANLFFHLRTGKPEYLVAANHLADCLFKSARTDDKGSYWEADNLLHLGLGYGQSGVALFLLRLYELTGREDALSLGKQALEFDLSHGVEVEPGVTSFPRAPLDPTYAPYLEEGSAGIAKVGMRYGMRDRMETILADAHRKYAGFAGLFFGLASFIDVLTDAYLLSRETRFLDMARRPASGIRDLYLLERKDGLATPGDGLFRVSCDYATGVAGVLRTLHRIRRHDAADFTLDELSGRSKCV